MTRTQAIILAVIAAVVFAAVFFWPERTRADVGVSVTGRIHLGDSVSLGARIGDGLHGRGLRGRHGRHPGARHRRDHYGGAHGGYRRGHRPVLVVPYIPRERTILRETVIETPPPPAAAVPAPPPEPPQVLDPRGQARTLSARGAMASPREWVLGEALPPDLPHVVLAASAYGLPQPPPGQIYARVEGDVLRIDAGTRRIVAVVAR